MRIIPFLIFLLLFSAFESFSQTTEEFFVEGHSTRGIENDTLDNYYHMVSWPSDQYIEYTYYKRDIGTQDVEEFMNYRLIYPVGYDPESSTEYPMIVMLHGAGESGRVWAGRFVYDPLDPRYDNNDHQLKHGGAQHQTAVNKDPLDPRSFNGFVLFPQSSYSAAWQGGWNNGVIDGDNLIVTHIMDHLIENLNINQNKIYTHGLSGGAVGVWDIVAKRPDLFAGMLPMSGVGVEEGAQTDILTTMPLWMFQGGKDYNPSPGYAQFWIDLLESKGAKPRYSLYPNLGHGTWNTAYAEPDFFSWMLDQDKRNIFVFGDETNLCPGAQIELAFSENYLTYQWYKDGDTIALATSDRFFVTEAGSYTVGFTRQNGSVDISFPLDITQDPSTYVPPIVVAGSVVLPLPNHTENPPNVGLELIGPLGYPEYNLYRNGIKVNTFTSNNILKIVQHWSNGASSDAGSYTITVSQGSGTCESLPSETVEVYYGIAGPNAPTLNSVTATSASDIDVVWTDNSSDEDYFEIWRSTNGAPDPYEPTRLYTIVPANSTTFHDSGLIPNKKYYYGVRAVNSNGGNNSSSIFAITWPDLVSPSAPVNLISTAIGEDQIDIAWEPSSDNIGVDHYDVYQNGSIIGSTTSLNYVITGLMPLTSYSINIRAVDAGGNMSSYANGLWITTTDTNPALSFNTYYSKSTGDLNDVNSWSDLPNGTGTAPTNFISSLQVFIISNGHNQALTSDWAVSGNFSKVIVESGETLTIQAILTGLVEVEDNAILNLENSSMPTIGNCGLTSTVNVSTNSVISRGNFGNLNISSAAQATLSPGATFVQGDLSINDASSLLLGEVGNLSVLNIEGDVNFNSSLAALQPDEYFGLHFTGSTPHVLNLPSENINFSKISADFGSSISFGSSSPISVNLGNESGGGLILEATSEILVGSTDLNVIGAGSINPGIETGSVSIAGGNISITSNSELYSNLYFDLTNHLVNDLVVDISSSARLTLFDSLDISNRLKIIDGTINVNNSITLLSSNTKTAYIDVIENNGLIIGDMIMQRHIRQGRKWRYVSSPFSGATIDDWQNTVPITGNFTGASVIQGMTSGPSLYYYDESIGLGNAGWVEYPPSSGDSTASIASGVGYSMFVRADDADIVFDMSGNPHQGDFNFLLTPDPSPGGSNNDGWNLIGNPYASAIIWDVDPLGWTTNGINDIIYVRDNELGGWRSYDRVSGLGLLSGGEIAPGQAFYVRTTVVDPAMTISETAKSANQPSFYRSTDPHNYVSIYLNANGSTDVTYIVVGDTNFDGFESAHDGIKRPNDFFNLSTLSSDSVELVINKVSDVYCSKTILLSIKDTEPGNYELSFENFDSFDIAIMAKLIDNYTSTEIDLLNNNKYNFNITSDSASFGKSRFTFVIEKPDIIVPSALQGQDSCNGSEPLVSIEGVARGARYQLYLNDTPMSDIYIGDENTMSLKVDTTSLIYGAQNLTLKAWYEFCGGKQNLGFVNVEYYDLLEPIISIQEELLVSNNITGNQWLLNGEMIDGAIESNYRPVESGEYSLVSTEGNCSTVSQPVIFVITGIAESMSSDSMNLYPNPSSGYIKIALESKENIKDAIVNIYNLRGMVVITKKMSEESNEIDVHGLPKGLYLVHVKFNSKTWKTKFIKE